MLKKNKKGGYMFIKMLASYAKIAANAKRTIDLGSNEIIDTTIVKNEVEKKVNEKPKLITYKKTKKIKEN